MIAISDRPPDRHWLPHLNNYHQIKSFALAQICHRNVIFSWGHSDHVMTVLFTEYNVSDVRILKWLPSEVAAYLTSRKMSAENIRYRDYTNKHCVTVYHDKRTFMPIWLRKSNVNHRNYNDEYGIAFLAQAQTLKCITRDKLSHTVANRKRYHPYLFTFEWTQFMSEIKKLWLWLEIRRKWQRNLFQNLGL